MYIRGPAKRRQSDEYIERLQLLMRRSADLLRKRSTVACNDGKLLLWLRSLMWLFTVIGESIALASPKIVCDVSEADLGAMEVHQNISHVFEIKNVGDSPLDITEVKRACGCTKAKLGVTVVAPGASTTLTVELTVGGASGKLAKRVVVESNDPVTPKLELRLVGTVISSVTVTPDRLHFGKVVGAEEVVRSFDMVVDDRIGPLSVIAASVDLAGADCHWDTILPGSLYRFEVTLKPPFPLGPTRGKVRIETTNDHYPLIEVPLSADVSGPISFSPQEIKLVAGKNASQIRYVMLSPGSVETFGVKSVDVPLPDIKSQVQTLGQRGYRVRLSDMPISGELDGKEVVIHTDAEAMSEIRIPIRVIAADPAAADATAGQ